MLYGWGSKRQPAVWALGRQKKEGTYIGVGLRKSERRETETLDCMREMETRRETEQI